MILTGRRKAAARYDELLQGMAEITTPFVPEGCTHAYRSYVSLYKADGSKLKDKTKIDWAEIESWNQERNRLMAELEKNGISVRQGAHAVHTLGYYKNKYGLNPTSCFFAILGAKSYHFGMPGRVISIG